MKKIIIFTLLISLFNISKAQWVYQDVNTAFFGSIKMAVNKSKTNCGYLSLEVNDILKINSNHFCDSSALVDVIFILSDSSIRKYQLIGSKTIDSKSYEFDMDIWNEVFLENFRSALKCIVKVNQEYCTNHIFEFNMSLSNEAYEFISK